MPITNIYRTIFSISSIRSIRDATKLQCLCRRVYISIGEYADTVIGAFNLGSSDTSLHINEPIYKLLVELVDNYNHHFVYITILHHSIFWANGCQRLNNCVDYLKESHVVQEFYNYLIVVQVPLLIVNIQRHWNIWKK